MGNYTQMARPTNVLWLIDHVCYDGSLHGGGRLFMNLVPKFDPARVRIHPYFLRASSEVQELFETANHKVTNLNLGKYDPRTLTRIAGLCRQHDIDVMHLFCYSASTFGRVVGIMNGVPTVIHDFDTQVYFPYPFYLRLADRLLARSTEKAFAASAFCRDYMRDTRAVPADRLEVMYHAIPASQLDVARQIDRATARRELGFGDEFLFAAITKLGPDRGNETLLEAFAEARRKLPNAKLVIVYKPTLYHRIPEEYEKIEWARDPQQMVARVTSVIDRLGLGDSVRLVESLDHPEKFYAACDVVVAPFESVRFSSVNLVEAMAYGRPSIVTDIGEPAELVDVYRSGIKVPVKDTNKMADAMVALATDPARMRELGQRARDGAANLTVDAVARRLSSVYEGLVSTASPKRAADAEARS
jgi:glycosyltransferase involved in cell wall biosynthesis